MNVKLNENEHTHDASTLYDRNHSLEKTLKLLALDLLANAIDLKVGSIFRNTLKKP